MKEEQIKKAMETSATKSLTLFNDACDELRTAKYIIAGGKISKLMLTIASSQPLFKLFDAITKGYNFIPEFEKAKFRDENGFLYLKPPAKAKELLCFTFCLLFAIDTNKIELKSLLTSFYSSSDANIEFSKFATELITPFQNSVNMVFTGKSPVKTDSIAADKTETDSKLEINETAAANSNTQSYGGSIPQKTGAPAYANNLAQKNDAQSYTNNLVQKKNDAPNDKTKSCLTMLNFISDEIEKFMAADTDLKGNDRKEILLINQSFKQAVSFGAEKTITIMYIALKNTLRCSSYFRNMETLYKKLNNTYELFTKTIG